ncbi:MAG: hydrogenase maturation protease [Candidatus Saccharicenans sp.]|jgi:hydrogenase 3 maturation protease|nr:hydrogenase maturation protease [Candidatus Saccharicenans sp.]MDH7492904.1 hydrogenase maturation protease [Candidatus Saccharicenans sp.]
MEAFDLLKEIVGQKTIFAGIGNALRGDDGFGPYFINKLKEKKLWPEDQLFTVEDVPENFAFPISRKEADYVIFVDAVIVDAPPGSLIFGPFEAFEEVGEIASTHRMSLKLTARVIEETGKKVFIIGVVPETMEFGRGMSPVVLQTAEELLTLVSDLLSEKMNPSENKWNKKPSKKNQAQKREKT